MLCNFDYTSICIWTPFLHSALLQTPTVSQNKPFQTLPCLSESRWSDTWMMAFIISTMCIHGPLSDQKSGIYRTASDVKFHPSAQQQMSLFHPFSASLPHTLSPWPCSPSRSLSFPHSLSSLLPHWSRRLDRLWVYVQSGRGSTQRINALLEKPREIQTSPCPRSFSLGPDSSHPPVSILMCPFHSLTSSLFLLSGYHSLHLSLVQANICVRFVPISANVMQDASQSTQWPIDS